MICSSVKRLGFMSIRLRGGGLYPFLEEIAGLRSTAISDLDLMWLFVALRAGVHCAYRRDRYNYLHLNGNDNRALPLP